MTGFEFIFEFRTREMQYLIISNGNICIDICSFIADINKRNIFESKIQNEWIM